MFPYWNDWFGAPLTQASFAGQDNRHAITIGSVHHNYTVAGVDGSGVTVPQNLTVSFGALGVTVTNLSGVTWASGAAVKLWVSRGTTGMVKDMSYAYDIPLTLRAPTVGSPAYQTADAATIWLVDLLGNYRPGTKHPLSPAGLPSKGAVEPASLA
ncbi:hypothetical protein ACOI1H_07275 [Loktanella sp. DJP18]|uniref:hypothetical protein n=1 Tax=Loktanella sp. DJP18 TaxID=3409788 RepID=UPI003BB77F00